MQLSSSKIRINPDTLESIQAAFNDIDIHMTREEIELALYTLYEQGHINIEHMFVDNHTL